MLGLSNKDLTSIILITVRVDDGMFRTPFITLGSLVLSEHPLASVVGAMILRSGGNAVDAAVAVSFSLSVLQPHLSGLGGDYFALIYVRDSNKVYFINGSGYAPRGVSIDFMKDLGFKEMPLRSPYSITIPGMVDALHSMWRRFGTLEWGELLKPSIKLAREGFPQYPSLVNAVRDNYELLMSDEGSRKTYLSSDTGVGNLIKFPNMGDALEAVAEDYRNFYEGEVAESIVNYLRGKGAPIDLTDFKEYRSRWGDVLRINYRGYDVYETPPNTQGVTTLHILKIMNELNISSLGPLSRERVCLFLRIFKAAYSVRDRYVGDPNYVRVDLLGDDVLQELFKLFNEQSLTTCNYLRHLNGDTTYYVVIDRDGNVVSGIQSIFHHFGSGITEPRYGVTLNNRGSSFTLDPTHVNALAPRKLPLHTLSTVMVFKDGELRWVLGTSGGHFRPQIHVELLTNLIDYGMDPQSSVELQRFIWDLGSGLVAEEGVDAGEIPGLNVRYVSYPSRLGVASILEIRDGVRVGASDIRGDGLGLGVEYP